MSEAPASPSLQGVARSAGRRVDPYLLLLLLLCLPVLGPLFASGYFYEAHDGRHSVFYSIQFDASLRSGALWPRWAMHHLQGYGYPTFIILAPAGFFLSELFVLLGAGFATAAKLTWATGVLLSAWGMYLLLLEWLNAPRRESVRGVDGWRLAAVAGSALYVYAPYRLVDIYVRGALNESLLFMWLPWLFLAWDRLITRGTQRRWTARLALAMLALAATWLTHSFAILSVTPLLAAFVLFRVGQIALRKQKPGEEDRREAGWPEAGRRVLLALGGGIGALLLCATFLVPLIVESPLLDQRVYTSDGYNVANHFVQLGQYFSPFWGYGYSDDPTGANDGMGFQIGVVALVVGMASLVLLGRKSTAPRGLVAFLFVATVIVLVVMSPLAAPLWSAVPVLSVIQFPWRLLVLASFTLCALGGIALGHLAEQPLRALSARDTGSGSQAGGLVVFAALAVVAVAGYADPQLQAVEPWREDGRAIYRFEEEYPDMIVGTQWTQEPFTTSPMSADYASDDYQEDHGRTTSLHRFSVEEGTGEVIRQESFGSRFAATVAMETPGVLRANLLYFPGWQATVDGEATAVRVAGPVGLVEFDVPEGEHEVRVWFGSTPARFTGTLLSWLGLAIVAGLLIAAAAEWRRAGRRLQR